MKRDQRIKALSIGDVSMKRFKGQHAIMEYILLTVFLIVVILMIVFFLTWWYGAQIDMERVSSRTDLVLSLIRQVSDTPYFVKENGMFDDSKLTAMKSLSCTELEKIFGYDWFMRVKALDGGPETECSENNYQYTYPNCNRWNFCVKNMEYSSNIVPINIYRKIDNRVEIGTLEVGVYE